MMTPSPTADQIALFAAKSAAELLHSKEGKRAGYWSKPLLGQARVAGGTFVILSYTYFVMGCSLAGISPEPFLQEGWVPTVADADSLASYYVEYPEVKAILDEHFRESDEYARSIMSAEMLNVFGNDSRKQMLDASPD